jgi:uncharacterized protein YecE (DUF72 family)
MGDILYGTSSWSSSGWDGVFYPKGMAPGDYLNFYAGRFRIVEADVTYYRVPSRQMVEGWRRKTPDDFTLCAKFPRTIVHAGHERLPDGDVLLMPERVGEDVDRFLTSMSFMGARCGPLVLQFPYFNKKVFTGPEPFLERLDRFLESLPGEFRYAVEVRNRTWLARPLLEVLRQHQVALVLVDLKYMPHPDELMDTMPLQTTDFIYVRLIGDRQAVESRTKTFDRIVMDQTPRLERWARLLHRMIPQARQTMVFANNHFAGHGPATIGELADLVEKESRDVDGED